MVCRRHPDGGASLALCADGGWRTKDQVALPGPVEPGLTPSGKVQPCQSFQRSLPSNHLVTPHAPGFKVALFLLRASW